MEYPFALLTQIEMLLLKEKLSRLPPYQQAKREDIARWDAFRATHPEALLEEVLDLFDCGNLLHAWERHAAFCLGLQLGLELDGLKRFWDAEP